MAYDTDLNTIGEFSRLIGVTASALRYYDDCGLLVPAHVDPRTGYRFYAPAQRERALTIRLLRDAGLPLSDVRRVVDVPADAARVIADHGERVAAEAQTAAEALRSAMWLLTDEDQPDAAVTVPGPQLASAIRQVTPAVDRSGAHEALAGVLLEMTAEEVRLVASDRHRLAVRTLPAVGWGRGVARIALAVTALRRLIPLLLQTGAVALRSSRAGITCTIDEQDHRLDSCRGSFPDYRTMLERWVRTDARFVVDRTALLAALEPVHDGRVIRVDPVDDGTVAIADAHTSTTNTLPCGWRGTRFVTWFDATHLAAALTVSVGADVILDLAAMPLPAVVRSADHGSLTMLVMPRRPVAPDDASKGESDGSDQPGGAAVRAGHGSRARRPHGRRA